MKRIDEARLTEIRNESRSGITSTSHARDLLAELDAVRLELHHARTVLQDMRESHGCFGIKLYEMRISPESHDLK